MKTSRVKDTEQTSSSSGTVSAPFSRTDVTNHAHYSHVYNFRRPDFVVQKMVNRGAESGDKWTSNPQKTILNVA